MTIYAGPVFEMAANQLKAVADHLEIPVDEPDPPVSSEAGDHGVLPDLMTVLSQSSRATACSTTSQWAQPGAARAFRPWSISERWRAGGSTTLPMPQKRADFVDASNKRRIDIQPTHWRKWSERRA